MRKQDKDKMFAKHTQAQKTHSIEKKAFKFPSIFAA